MPETEAPTFQDQYYDYILRDSSCGEYNKFPTTEAQRIAFTILSDVTDRRGWRQEWDGFDEDIQEEVIETWIEKIQVLIDEAHVLRGLL